MKKDKLISMCDYILNAYNKRMDTPYNDGAMTLTDVNKFIAYAQFLKTPLSIDMFVPAVFESGSWRVLEIPDYESADDGNGEDIDKVDEFWHTSQKVLFEGFTMDYKGKTVTTFSTDDFSITFHDNPKDNQFITVEDLVKYGLTLTENTRIKLGFTNQ